MMTMVIIIIIITMMPGLVPKIARTAIKMAISKLSKAFRSKMTNMPA